MPDKAARKMKKLEEKNLELSKKIADFESAKKETYLIMKDLSLSKKHIEEEKTKDEILLESIGDGVIAVDGTAQIIKINGLAKKILNIRGDAVGKGILTAFQIYDYDGISLITPDRRPETVVLKSGKHEEATFLIMKKNGKKRIVAIIANPVIQNNTVIGAIMVYRDITKEREADRMKTEFISLASHQLRTPLSAIKWFSEMLLSGDAGKLNSEQNDFAKNIADSTQRMIQLVNSLLNISRIESGRIIIDPQPTDLSQLVQGVIQDLKAKIEEKEQNIIVSVHRNLPKINLDPRLIRQVYMNLLTNSIKYTPKKGEITVFISRKGKNVISQVSDNGCGIPEEDQPKIFQKFFRSENVAKFETDGTGLGLYLIKAIIASSRGEIWFKSKEGNGTTFWFTLPLKGMKPKQGDVTLD